MPIITPFGLLGVTLAVIPGLLVSRTRNLRRPLIAANVTIDKYFGLQVGAVISKNIASFLEENDLFSPQDDDDDD